LYVVQEEQVDRSKHWGDLEEEGRMRRRRRRKRKKLNPMKRTWKMA
jgi:hypothetical protein